MDKAIRNIFPLAATLMGLSACGGGTSLGIAPAPPPAPPPTVAPSPGPSPLPSPIGLTSEQPFATAYASPTRGTGENFGNGAAPRSDQNLALEFRYLPASNSYEITLPGQASGRLEPYFSNGISTASHTIPTGGNPLPDGRVHLPVPGKISSPYSYTSFGYWNPQDETPKLPGQSADRGAFVYGLPTRPGDVPVFGQASYSAVVIGYVKGGPADGFAVNGTVRLDFDFANGRLGGFMNPQVPESGWAGFGHDLGRYDFTQTVFAAGSTSFAGKFIVPNLAGSASNFSGTFTGPRAEEIMARFEAAFLANGVSGTLLGVWIGKRD